MGGFEQSLGACSGDSLLVHPRTKPAVFVQPIHDDSLPAIARHEEQAMLAFFEQMGFDGNAGVPQGFEEYDAVVHIDQPVVGGLEDQSGRGVLGDLQLIGEEPDLFFRRVLAQQRDARTHVGDLGVHADDRVDHDEEVRAQAGMIRIVDVGMGEVCGQRRGQVSSGGKADGADSVRIEIPSGRVLTGESHRLLGVLQRPDGLIDHRLVAREAVFDDEGGDAVIDKIAGLLEAFEIPSEAGVTAARKDHHAGARGFDPGGQINLDRRLRDLLDPALVRARFFVRAGL